MTSGTFQAVPYSFIWVDREKRQRRELRGIDELAASIAANGLIHPPVIKRDGELIAGERRWTAIGTLGWDTISVQFIDDLSEEELHMVELEENIRRQDITWQEQCAAIAKYHEAKVAQDSKWTAAETAKALNITASEVANKREVAKAIDTGLKLVKDAPLYSTALNIVKRDRERRKSSAVEELKKGPKALVPLLHTDFAQWLETFDEEPFNFIHCDFPYGVEMQDSDQGSGKSFGTYSDTKEDYWRCINLLAVAMQTAVAPSAHLMFWFSMDYYHETKEALEEMGWKINPFPLIWYKSDNIGILPDAQRGPRRIYETCFFGSRGDRLIVRSVSNVAAFPGRHKEVHMNEKPVEMLKHFASMFVDEYSSILDPTAGSGNVLKAANALGARRVLGLERNEQIFNLAKDNFNVLTTGI
jgi:ParB/RepB/Spo0J family partition protein